MSEISTAQEACRVLRDAAELLREDPIRQGSLLVFGSAGQLVMTGDMHGNLRNFEKLQRFCDLKHTPGRYVILHELIHADPDPSRKHDTSINLLLRAAAYKCEFPDNVFMIQSNHELSQLCGHEITKGGRSVIQEFERGVALRFDGAAHQVLEAVQEYLAALPLAATTANGIFMAHSVPDPLSMSVFDTGIFQRTPTREDMEPGGSAYTLVWGRFQSPESLDYFAQRLNVKFFVVGHTPQEMGYGVVGRMIVLASDHQHGSFLPIDLGREYTIEELERAVKKFVAVA